MIHIDLVDAFDSATTSSAATAVVVVVVIAGRIVLSPMKVKQKNKLSRAARNET